MEGDAPKAHLSAGDNAGSKSQRVEKLLKITSTLSGNLAQWDVNKDGYLSEEELLGVLRHLGIVKRDVKRHRIYLIVVSISLVLALGVILGLTCLAVYLVKDTRVRDDNVLIDRQGDPVHLAEYYLRTPIDQWQAVDTGRLLATKRVTLFANNSTLVRFKVDAISLTNASVTFSSCTGWSATLVQGNTTAIVGRPDASVTTGQSPSGRRLHQVAVDPPKILAAGFLDHDPWAPPST